jgi:hypothetical protein
MKIEKVVEKVVKLTSEEYRREVEAMLKLLIEEYRIPEKDAVATVLKKLKERGVKIKNNAKKIAEITQDDTNVTFVAKVLAVKPVSKNAKAVITVGDDTGHARIIVTDDVEFEAGKVYLFRNVMVGENGALVFTRNSTARESDAEIQVKPKEMVGAIVAVAKNSGHIVRCKECGAPLKRGVCPEHGATEYHESLEARIVVDNGRVARRFTLTEEQIEKLTGITLEEARQIKNTFDNEAVRQEIIERTVGRYVKVKYLSRVPQEIEFTTGIPVEVV